MADLNFATISFLSWVRQGLAARSGVAGSVGVKDGHLTLPISLRLNNAKLTDVPVQIYGPGDITGIDAREIIRTEPQHMMANFEPNYFPFVEFDHPDFPWMFTPAIAGAAGVLQPWLCLVVVPRDAANITIDTKKPLPVLDCPMKELPDLSEAWAWAHAQVARTASVSDMNVALGKQDRNLSRLLCPRRLDPVTGYYACLVPTYDVGRKVGLGDSFTKDEEKALALAWTPTTDPQKRIQLPVYHHWEFSTGVEGDFEALARRLQPQDLPENVGLNEVDVSNPGWGVGPFPATAAGSVMQMEGALRNPAKKSPAWADDVRVPFQAKLRQILDTTAKPAGPSGTPTLVGPPLYGQWYPKLDSVPAAGSPPYWFSEANLELKFRIAAGLGTLVVRFEQEDLMASAWDQLAAQRADNEQLKRAQLAEAVGQTLVDKHLAPLTPQSFVQVTAPIHAAVVQNVAAKAAPAMRMAATAVAPAAPVKITASASLLAGPQTSAAFRRLARARGPIVKRAAPILGKVAKTAAPIASALAPTSAPATSAVTVLRAAVSKTAPAPNMAALKSTVLGQINPKVTALATVQQDVPQAQSTDLIQFAPTFSEPMYEALRDFFNDMLLPGLENVPPNSITLLETNPQFVEAFMLGVNHEMSRELLWRGYPTDQRGTYFRQFWDVSGRVPPPTAQERAQLADIKPLTEWPAASHLGEHAQGNTSASMMVLAVRGDLLNRYPRAIIYAVEALWSSTAKNASRTLGTKELYPMFRVTRAPDITMLGFAVNATQARGADAPTGTTTPSNDAGYFFVLQEQPTEPRFGLDAATDKLFGARPAQWSDLSWAHLAPNATALKQITYVPMDGPLKGVTLGSGTWGKNSAHMGFITRQSPFRLAVHARTWLR